MKNKEDFIKQAREIHGDKYDYSKVEYINKTTDVCIICPEHGEFFTSPSEHIRLRRGCRACGRKKVGDKYRKSNEEIIKEFIEVHGNRYDYSKVQYINAHADVTIICPIHGEFQQTPHSHLKGANCPECYKEEKQGNSDFQNTFIEKANLIHKGKYDYSQVKYVNNRTLVKIICPKHGVFEQTPGNHIAGCGCKYCGTESRINSQYLTTDEFIKRAHKVHGNKYNYSLSKYKKWDENITIICPIHGNFEQTPREHLSGCGCSKCNCTSSKPEQEITEIVNELNLNVIKNDRTIIKPYELDIYIPSKKVAIEYNGLYWHTEDKGKDKYYHINKLKMCQKNSIKLIQIFEDEYINHKELVLNKIKHLLSEDTNKKSIPGRKCYIHIIDKDVAAKFLNEYHIQGFSSSTIYLGAYYNNILVAVMTFKREHKTGNTWELTRFASDYHYICQGVGGKLFKFFVRNYNPEEVKSFADRRWTIDETDNLYTKLGFEINRYLKPDYQYFDNKIISRQHKFGFRKQILSKKYNLPLTMTEDEMTKKIGLKKIWNCGLIKYVWAQKKGCTI